MKSEPKSLKSINIVLLRYFLLLAFILIVLVEVTCFIIVSNTTEYQARERLMHTGKEIAQSVDTASDEQIARLIRDYRTEGINVYVLHADGGIIFPHEDSGGNWSGLEGLKEKISSSSSGAVIYVENNNLNYVTTVDYNGENYLIASYSMKVMHGTERMLLLYFLIVGVVVLLIAGIISYNISQKLSGGIKELSTTAVRFSKGNFNVNFTNAEYEELAALSDTLNSVRDEVKKSGDFQRELLANVSHDLKTPLTMIKDFASMIREISGNNPEKREQHLQVIIDEADRLTGLVNDVLDVSKVSSNIDAVTVKVFNLTEFLYGIINKFKYLQETQNYSFMVDVDSNLYTRADEEKIGQVIYNLLGNAVNYTGSDKTVYISLKKSLTEDRIKLTIKDTGKGIAKEDLSEIWNRYYRVKEEHSRPVKGTGLGLSIVKIILENHAFDFGVESEIGKGSSFWVDFPSVPEEIDIKAV